ncbi:ArsR/SmtB family transcription factor [Cellulomonas persica]|uniref:Transcriptional regulator n=1 Tax=Cellulomonas persica TaxID=76861 RepID=A0A510URL0_9CELL|nr:helix-turn-helix domain-containing protein [Cellulomonas persica]GEK17294.1 transcriptional regulator [Cellulomonas persica]
MTERKGQNDAGTPGTADVPPIPAVSVPPAPAEQARPGGPAVELPNPLGAEALKAFAHPLRIAMYRYLSAHGSGTASQIARALGESTGQTSYHLRQLERHGIIEDDPNAAPGGRERWWRPVGFSLDRRNIQEPGARLAIETTLRAVIAERAETLQEWFDSIDTAAPWDDAALHTSSTSSLSVEEAQALGVELQAVLDRHTDAAKARKDAGDGVVRRRVRVYLDVFPLPADG